MSGSTDSNAELRQRLHDGLCQQLTAALMFADALRRGLEQRSAAETPDAERLVEILKGAADEVVQLMNDLSPRGGDESR